MPVRRSVLACILAVAALAAAPAAADRDAGVEATTHTISGDETFVSLMAHYDLGYVELAAANPGIDPWLPEPGRVLILPTVHLLPEAERKGIVINLADQRLYYFPGEDAPPESYPVGIGRAGWETPTGTTTIVRKRVDPVWIPTPSMREANPALPRAVGPGPDNPLGPRALDFGWEYIVLHGTNRPAGVGRRVSHGCVRLTSETVTDLFERIPVGTPVTVVDQPVKTGRIDGALHIEAHPTQSQADEIEETGRFTPAPVPPGIAYDLITAAGGDSSAIDWDTVERALAERRGVPVRVTARETPELAGH